MKKCAYKEKNVLIPSAAILGDALNPLRLKFSIIKDAGVRFEERQVFGFPGLLD